MEHSQVELLFDQEAYARLNDAQFIASWRTLHAKCSHATVFQHPGFVCAWYESYRPIWKPVIALAQNATGELTGLWTLAYDPSAKVLAHAGAHQAEYHAWLALPGEDAHFLASAWAKIKQQLEFKSLLFSFLLDWNLVDVLQTAEGLQGCLTAQKFSRPLLHLDPDEVKSAFTKKSNKSRFNRLNKLGKLEFRRVTDPADLEQLFDELITCYDFRQGAINQSRPFQEDPYKRPFHIRVFTSAPDETYVTVASLDGKPISGFWGSVSGETVHLGMIMNSPFLAEHSPGKLHIMQLSENLLSTGKQTLDLTPGGTWKERFANASADVAKVVLYRTAKSQKRAAMRNRLVEIGKRASRAIGIQPSQVKQVLAKLKPRRIPSTVRDIKNWIQTTREIRVYEVDGSWAGMTSPDLQVHRNSLTDLLQFDPTNTGQRDAFLSKALERLENGESVYTVLHEGRLTCCGWMVAQPAVLELAELYRSASFPQEAVFIHDLYSHPTLGGPGQSQAVIAAMLSQAFAQDEAARVHLLVPAESQQLSEVVESMGLHQRGAFFGKSRFGKPGQWTNTLHSHQNQQQELP